jgi:hypothetical protein
MTFWLCSQEISVLRAMASNIYAVGSELRTRHTGSLRKLDKNSTKKITQISSCKRLQWNLSTVGRRLTTYATYDHKKLINKLIINQDVLLRTLMKSTILTKQRQGPIHEMEILFSLIFKECILLCISIIY